MKIEPTCEHDFSDYSHCEKCDSERHACVKCGEDEGIAMIEQLITDRDQVIKERDEARKMWVESQFGDNKRIAESMGWHGLFEGGE